MRCHLKGSAVVQQVTEGSKGGVSVMSQWLCVSKASVQVGICEGESKVGKLG